MRRFSAASRALNIYCHPERGCVRHSERIRVEGPLLAARIPRFQPWVARRRNWSPPGTTHDSVLAIAPPWLNLFWRYLRYQLRQCPDDLHCLLADGDDLSDQAHDVFWVVGAVGIVGDATALVGRDLILVDDLFQRRAVAEAVFVSFGRDTLER